MWDGREIRTIRFNQNAIRGKLPREFGQRLGPGKRDDTREGDEKPNAQGEAGQLLARRKTVKDASRGRFFLQDLLRVFVRDVDLEGLFKRENQLDETERVGTKVVDERLYLDAAISVTAPHTNFMKS